MLEWRGSSHKCSDPSKCNPIEIARFEYTNWQRHLQRCGLPIPSTKLLLAGK